MANRWFELIKFLIFTFTNIHIAPIWWPEFLPLYVWFSRRFFILIFGQELLWCIKAYSYRASTFTYYVFTKLSRKHCINNELKVTYLKVLQVIFFILGYGNAGLKDFGVHGRERRRKNTARISGPRKHTFAFLPSLNEKCL